MASVTGVQNLMTDCILAIGALQAMDPIQPRLIGGWETTFGEIPLKFQEKLQLEITPQWGLERTVEEQMIIQRIPTTYVRVYDFLGCDTFDKSNISDIHSLQNWRSFSDVKLSPERSWLLGIMDPMASSLKKDKKESWYWALRMRFKARMVVPGIIDAAKANQCTEWILPNQMRVPFDAVKALPLEVHPNNLYIFERPNYLQNGGLVTSDSSVVIPQAVLTPMELTLASRILKAYHRNVIPGGITRLHYVIEAILPDGTSYIVDPTSMQFNYRGPNGSLVAHGTWDEYVKGFPGQVLKRVTEPLYPTVHDIHTREAIHLKSAIDEMYYLGNGPQQLIQNLLKNINGNRRRRHCAYCGWIEGEHGIRPRPNCRYNFKGVALMCCGKCKTVAYCDKKCQKAHWKEHKTVCSLATSSVQ